MILCSQCLAACHSKANIWETSVGWKEKFALFKRPGIWREGSLMSKSQLWGFSLTIKVFKKRTEKIITVNHLGSVSSLSSTACKLFSDWLVVKQQCVDSTQVGALVPVEELILYILLRMFLEKEPEPCAVVSKLFLLLQSQTFLISKCLNLPFGNHGKQRDWTRLCFLTTIMKPS